MWTAKERGVIAVGVNGSPESLAAARYAVAEAELRGLNVLLLHSYQLPPVDLAFAVDVADRFRDRGQQLLRQVQAQLDIPRHLHVETVLRETTAAILLGDAAAVADLIVLGKHHRRRGAVTLGTIASHAAATATCPVVTVPAGQPTGGPGHRPVVVALDGTTSAEAALDYAVDEAARRRSVLVALHAKPLTTWPVDVEKSRTTIRDLVRRRNDRIPEDRVRVLVVPGDPDDAITEASRDAAVVVVGHPHSHRPGAWSTSVARAVLGRANCPLVVLPRAYAPAALVAEPASISTR
jgi:nucleotide-binding universal stress UspA family protein